MLEHSLALKSDILGQFVNKLTGNDKYFCHYRENFGQIKGTKYLIIQRYLKIFCVSEKDEHHSLHIRVILKLLLRIPLNSQHITASQTLLKFAQNHFYHFVYSIVDELICKLSLLVRSEILGLFVIT